MYTVIQCLTQDHSLGLVALAALVCVVGSSLSALMAGRLRQTSRSRMAVQIALTSLIVGGTVWTTHFIAMLAYDPGYEHGYDPVITGLSLCLAVLGMGGANTIFALSKNNMIGVARRVACSG